MAGPQPPTDYLRTARMAGFLLVGNIAMAMGVLSYLANNKVTDLEDKVEAMGATLDYDDFKNIKTMVSSSGSVAGLPLALFLMPLLFPAWVIKNVGFLRMYYNWATRETKWLARFRRSIMALAAALVLGILGYATYLTIDRKAKVTGVTDERAAEIEQALGPSSFEYKQITLLLVCLGAGWVMFFGVVLCTVLVTLVSRRVQDFYRSIDPIELENGQRNDRDPYGK